MFTSGLKAHDRNTLLEAGFRKKHLCGFAIGTRCCCTVFFRPTKGASVDDSRIIDTRLSPWILLSQFLIDVGLRFEFGDWSPFAGVHS